MTIQRPILHYSSADAAGRRSKYAQLPWLGDEVVADKVELLQVSDGRRCGGLMGGIYIEGSETSHPIQLNLSVVIIQKPERLHHEVF